MDNLKNYSAPALEVVELAVENAVLLASGEDSTPGYGE